MRSRAHRVGRSRRLLSTFETSPEGKEGCQDSKLGSGNNIVSVESERSGR